MRRIIPLSLVLLIGVIFGLQSTASAAPIGVINGATQLNITSFDTLTIDLGITVTPGGTAEVISISFLPSPIVFYEVTEVDLDPAMTQIFHEGSNLALETEAGVVDLSNFIIDATQGVVLADVVSDSLTGNAPVFDITQACSVSAPCLGLDGTATIEGLELQLTAAAAGLLASDLDIPDLTGTDTPIAIATSSFTPIPEPGTGLLALTGLALLAAGTRRLRP